MRKTLAILSISAFALSLGEGALWSSTAQEGQAQAVTPAPETDSVAAQAEQPTVVKPKNIKEWVSTNRSRKGSAVGAVAGAILGGLIARATHTTVWKGVALGAAVGGVTGYLIGQHRDQIYYSRDQAVREASYDPSQGYVIRIQSVGFDPQSIKPGDSATLRIRYLVIGPDPRETIRITCFRGIKYQDSYLVGEGPVTLTVPKGGGVVESTVQFVLPKEAPAGTYTAEAMLEDSQGRFNSSETSPLYIAS